MIKAQPCSWEPSAWYGKRSRSMAFLTSHKKVKIPVRSGRAEGPRQGRLLRGGDTGGKQPPAGSVTVVTKAVPGRGSHCGKTCRPEAT